MSKTTGVSRSWRIKVTQYACDSPGRAPEGCLQYFSGINGNVTSFNWKLTDNALGTTFSNHLANLDYSVCIRYNKPKLHTCFSKKKILVNLKSGLWIRIRIYFSS